MRRGHASIWLTYLAWALGLSRGETAKLRKIRRNRVLHAAVSAKFVPMSPQIDTFWHLFAGTTSAFTHPGRVSGATDVSRCCCCNFLDDSRADVIGNCVQSLSNTRGRCEQVRRQIPLLRRHGRRRAECALQQRRARAAKERVFPDGVLACDCRGRLLELRARNVFRFDRARPLKD